MKKNKYITVGVCVAVLANIITAPTIAIAESVTQETVDTTESVIDEPAKELPTPVVPPIETKDSVSPDPSTPPVTPTPAPNPSTPSIPAKDTTATTTSSEKQPDPEKKPQQRKENKNLRIEVAKFKTINKGDIFNPLEGVYAYFDGKNISSDIKIISNNVDTAVVTHDRDGITTTPYYVVYSITAGDQTVTQKVEVHVLDKSIVGKQTAEINDFTVYQGSNIDEKIAQSLVVKNPDGTIANPFHYTVSKIGDIDANTPGTYTISVVVASKTLGTRVEKTVTITVLATVTLNASDRVIIVGDTFDPREGVSAFETKADGSTVALPFKEGLHDNGISYSGDVDTTTVGNYPVTYKVRNSQGQTIKKTVTISVVAASTSSLRIISEDAEIMQGETFDPHIYAILVDSTEGHVYNVLTVSGDTVDSSVLGAEYYVTFNAEYKGNVAEPVTIKITVVGRFATIETDDQTVNVGDVVTEADILSWATANDPVDGDNLPITDYTVLDGPIDTSVAGNQFSIEYSFTNSAGNTTTETITLIVANLPAPTLKVEDKELFVGDKLTEDMILEWAEAENATAISYEVLGDPIRVNRLDNTLVETGVHKIKFTATNDQPVHNTSELKPRTVEKTITLTVKDKDGKTPKDPIKGNNGKDDKPNGKDTVNLSNTKAKTDATKKTKGDNLTKTNVSLGAMPAFGGVSAAIGSLVAYLKGKKKK